MNGRGFWKEGRKKFTLSDRTKLQSRSNEKKQEKIPNIFHFELFYYTWLGNNAFIDPKNYYNSYQIVIYFFLNQSFFSQLTIT